MKPGETQKTMGPVDESMSRNTPTQAVPRMRSSSRYDGLPMAITSLSVPVSVEILSLDLLAELASFLDLHSLISLLCGSRGLSQLQYSHDEAIWRAHCERWPTFAPVVGADRAHLWHLYANPSSPDLYRWA